MGPRQLSGLGNHVFCLTQTIQNWVPLKVSFCQSLKLICGSCVLVYRNI
uniref:Uncharacterized protein n=1 Tax=Anguilla anguilla TaxID=7936 RepID=A0A0E9QS41_ANGAN